MNKYISKVRKHFQSIMETKTSSHSIALGFAVGTFIEMLPTPGFNFLIAALVVLIFKKINKYAVFCAVIVLNTFILAPIYALGARIGYLLFGSEKITSYSSPFLNNVLNFFRNFFVGNLIMACIFSVISYFVVKKLVDKYRAKMRGETLRQRLKERMWKNH